MLSCVTFCFGKTSRWIDISQKGVNLSHFLDVGDES